MDKISDAIKCVNCRNVLDLPVILPCGCSICKKHTIELKGTTILCCSCEIDHPLPLNGHFLPNKGLAKIIEAEISALDFGKEHSEAKKSCSRLDEILTNIENVLKDPLYITYEAIEYLKNAAQLKVEEMKKKLDNELACLIAKLVDFQTNCKANLNSNAYKGRSERFERKREAGRQELDQWFTILNELKLNETKCKKIKSDSENSIKRFEDELAKFKAETLLQRLFDVFRDEVENKFGKFEIDPKFIFRLLHLTFIKDKFLLTGVPKVLAVFFKNLYLIEGYPDFRFFSHFKRS
jgi:hypothetical protein